MLLLGNWESGLRSLLGSADGRPMMVTLCIFLVIQCKMWCSGSDKTNSSVNVGQFPQVSVRDDDIIHDHSF